MHVSTTVTSVFYPLRSKDIFRNVLSSDHFSFKHLDTFQWFAAAPSPICPTKKYKTLCAYTCARTLPHVNPSGIKPPATPPEHCQAGHKAVGGAGASSWPCRPAPAPRQAALPGMLRALCQSCGH